MSKNRERMWVPEVGKVKEPQKIVVETSAGSLAGLVKLELLEAATGIVKECYEFPNIILTAGLDGLVAGRPMVEQMLTNMTIGTGSTPVSPSDLSLDEEVERTTDDGGINDVFGYQTGSGDGLDTGDGHFGLGNPYHFIKRTRVFLENEANFPTLSELGWRSDGPPEYQFTRTLIKDVTGSLITIAKTDQDQLRITYEIRGYPLASHITGAFVIADSETSHSFTASGVDIDNNGSGQGWSFSPSVAGGAGARGFFHSVGNFAGGGTSAAEAYASASAPGNPTGTIQNWGGWVIGSPRTMSGSTAPYVCGSFARTNTATWEPAFASFGSGGLQGMSILFERFSPRVLAMYFTPSIKKTDLQRLSFAYTTTITASTTSSA